MDVADSQSSQVPRKLIFLLLPNPIKLFKEECDDTAHEGLWRQQPDEHGGE
jgi:hypothetical protein